MDELLEDYFLFLISEYGLNDQIGKTHSKLLDMLYAIPFRYIIERDENRAGDGQELRDNYCIPIDISYGDEDLIIDFMERPCSVLEMLIALAIRIDEEYLGDPADPHPEDFFWEMIKNLGLGKFTNGKFCFSNIKRIIDMWMNRQFTKNGLGSPFPVYNDNQDQRNLEIWDQMNAYIYENYT